MPPGTRKRVAPRYLVFRHARRLQLFRAGTLAKKLLQPGEELLHSFLVLGLQGGLHFVEVEQKITANSQDTTLSSKQEFYVDTPQFSLPEGEVHSVYPPPGHEERSEALPHVVFNTPTMPWEWRSSDNKEADDYLANRNRAPWLAVLVFTKDELELSPEDLAGDKNIFRSTTQLSAGAKQTSTLAVNMLVSDISELEDTVTPVQKPPEEPEVTTDVIFLKNEVFTTLFTEYGKDGKPVTGATGPDVRAHRFLAHIRDINTEGMAVAALTATEDDQSSFGVVVSHRTGPVSITEPTQSVRDRVLKRLEDGYTLARYRIKSGESTACFIRGPFIPVKIPSSITRPWHSLSTSGGDLQILDQQLGLMDISYSAAWQLGRTLAISDQDFVTRISQVRKQIYDRGMQYAQEDALYTYGTRTRKDIIAQLPTLIASLKQLPQTAQLATRDSQARSRRWRRTSVEPVDLSYQGREVFSMTARLSGQKTVEDHLMKAAKEVASAPSAQDPESPSNVPYNEFNTPFSADWMSLLKWVLDKTFLENIPFHYLVPETSNLPLETIRFFRIDWRWMDALIDGALSLSNYIDQEDDKVRDAIFAAIKWYRDTKVPELGDEVPPIPEYGCLVRSALITKFVDMKVEVLPQQPIDKPPILLRHKIISSDTMLCLFSQEPKAPNFTGLSFTQPPHQESFVAAAKLNDSEIEMTYKRAYTADCTGDDPTIVLKEVIRERNPASPGDLTPLYLWDGTSSTEARLLLMESLANDYLKELTALMEKKYFEDSFPSSALMARQLGSPCWRLLLSLTKKLDDGEADVEVLRSDMSLPQWIVDPKPQIPEPGDPDTLVESQIPLPLDPMASRPQFSYRVASTDSPRSSEIIATELEQDLIFRITLEPYTAGTYKMELLTINILFGEPGQRPPRLTKAYRGSGAEMISNLRFNVMVDTITKDGAVIGMVLRMVPRSRRGWVPVTSCNELSFILSGIQVSQVTTKTYVSLDIKEQYLKQGTWPPYSEPDSVVLVPPQTKEVRDMRLKEMFGLVE